MDPHQLLIRHARDWAEHRSRPLDTDLLAEALQLRSHQDELPAQEWPTGSAQRLLLVTWPAYGSAPQPQALHDTLDTFWPPRHRAHGISFGGPGRAAQGEQACGAEDAGGL